MPGMDDTRTDKFGSKAAPIALRIVNGPRAGEVLNLPSPAAVIGRNDPPEISVDIDLTDAELSETPMTSRRHARIEQDLTTGETFLTDLGSTNGTWINDLRLAPKMRSSALTVPSQIRFANLEIETIHVNA